MEKYIYACDRCSFKSEDFDMTSEHVQNCKYADNHCEHEDEQEFEQEESEQNSSK